MTGFSPTFPGTNRIASQRGLVLNPLLLRPLTAGLILLFSTVAANVLAAQSIARVWDEEILNAIRIDLPHPPVHARNLFHFSAAMYDPWAAYDPVGIVYIYKENHPPVDPAAARREAISYAAYRILKERYTLSRAAAQTLARLDARMVALGYDTNKVST